MFDLVDDASRREKCFTTISQLPAFVDPKQIPSKRSPFSTIQNHAFVHSVGGCGSNLEKLDGLTDD